MTTNAIDPEIQLFVDRIAQSYARYPDVLSAAPDEARAIVEKVRQPWREGGPKMASIEEFEIALPSGLLPVRVYRPIDRPLAPALVYLHGGGFTFFSVDTHDRLMREYAKGSGFNVVGVSYPLAPECKFPIALDAVVELIVWLRAHGSDLGIDPQRLAIGGDSAGGNLAFAAAVDLRDQGNGHVLKGLLLNYPGLSPDHSLEAIAVYGGPDAILPASEAEFFWSTYAATDADRTDPRANLGLADVARLPAMLFIVAEVDLLAEQSHDMARRVSDAGGVIELRAYRGAVHGFIEAMSVSSLARAAIADSCAWLVSLFSPSLPERAR